MGILGFPASDSAEALRWGSYDGHGNRYLPPERRENMEDGIRAMVAHVRAAVVDRHEQPRDDVLSAFVRDRVEADGRLDLPNVTAEVVNFINGGMHTTRDMLGNTLRFLLEDPERRARAVADPRSMIAAIDESLRLESTLQWTGRLALTDSEIAGTPIPAGSIVILLLASANRDCRAFARPDEFDLDRADLKSHLAFGTHIHSCLGAPLARVEGRIAFERLFARLPRLQLADDNDFAPRASLNFRGLAALRLAFDPQ
jgi:cytochrome P450